MKKGQRDGPNFYNKQFGFKCIKHNDVTIRIFQHIKLKYYYLNIQFHAEFIYLLTLFFK